jgi:hypothetical protein
LLQQWPEKQSAFCSHVPPLPPQVPPPQAELAPQHWNGSVHGAPRARQQRNAATGPSPTVAQVAAWFWQHWSVLVHPWPAGRQQAPDWVQAPASGQHAPWQQPVAQAASLAWSWHTPAVHAWQTGHGPVWQARPQPSAAPHAWPVQTGVQQAPVVAWQTAPAAQQPPEQQTAPAPQAVPFATGVPAQAPAVQTSPVVQGLLSSQVVPSEAVGLEQAPVVGAQVPATWHWSLVTQLTAWVVPQAPAAQVAARHLLVGGGQSVAEVHWQTWRPAASLAQRREQQLACSRQSWPGVRQVTAPARSRPRIPNPPATSPDTKRRRLPDWASERAMASNLEPSTDTPLPEAVPESTSTR